MGKYALLFIGLLSLLLLSCSLLSDDCDKEDTLIGTTDESRFVFDITDTGSYSLLTEDDDTINAEFVRFLTHNYTGKNGISVKTTAYQFKNQEDDTYFNLILHQTGYILNLKPNRNYQIIHTGLAPLDVIKNSPGKINTPPFSINIGLSGLMVKSADTLIFCGENYPRLEGYPLYLTENQFLISYGMLDNCKYLYCSDEYAMCNIKINFFYNGHYASLIQGQVGFLGDYFVHVLSAVSGINRFYSYYLMNIDY
jgi:hypothetical protein